MKRTAIFLATGAYTGLVPFAPGTAGSLFASIALLFVPSFSHIFFFLGIALLGLAGIWAASEAERYYQVPDAQQIVIDEIVGMMVSVYFFPAGWKTILPAFILFRFFDILKPFPARQAEKAGNFIGKLSGNSPRLFSLAGGVGVMLDDIVAGIYANIVWRALLVMIR